MPMRSQKQRALMYATAAGADTGVPKSVAKEFVASDKPGKLPKYAKGSREERAARRYGKST